MEKNLLRRIWSFRSMYLFLMPAVVWYIIFMYKPIYGLQIAFKNYTFKDGISGSEWVGLLHFQKMFMDPFFMQAFMNTIVISLLKLVFVATSGLVLALLLNEVRNRRFRGLVQDISLLTHFFSWVVISSIMIEILSPSSGLINIVRMNLGLDSIYYLAEKNWFLFWVIASDIWESAGWNAIIFIAAIAGISPELYESASIDGAGRFAKLIHITVPGISGTIFIVMVLKIGGMMNAGFDQIYNLYNSAVMDVADILDTYTFRLGMQQLEFSYASAVGLLKNLIGLVLVLMTNYIAKKNGEEGLW